jgi:hypothetical protein
VAASFPVAALGLTTELHRDLLHAPWDLAALGGVLRPARGLLREMGEVHAPFDEVYAARWYPYRCSPSPLAHAQPSVAQVSGSVEDDSSRVAICKPCVLFIVRSEKGFSRIGLLRGRSGAGCVVPKFSVFASFTPFVGGCGGTSGGR